MRWSIVRSGLTFVMYLFMSSGLLSSGSHCFPRRGCGKAAEQTHSTSQRRHQLGLIGEEKS